MSNAFARLRIELEGGQEHLRCIGDQEQLNGCSARLRFHLKDSTARAIDFWRCTALGAAAGCMDRFVHPTEVQGNGRGLACNQAEQQKTDDDPSASHGIQDTTYTLTEAIYTRLG